MGAWRCTNCGVNWPPNEEFDYCPQCGGYTQAIRNASPEYDLDEAISISKHCKFEKKYKKYEKTADPKRLVPTAEDRVKYPFRPELGNRAKYGERDSAKAETRAGLHGRNKT